MLTINPIPKVFTLPEKILEDLLYANSINSLNGSNSSNRNYIKTIKTANNINYQPLQGA